MNNYLQLISDLFQKMKLPLPPSLEKEGHGLIEFTADNLVVRTYPHAAGSANNEVTTIIIEADLMLLDLENREVNHDRFLILHQLNTISRLTTGIIAFISEEGMLSVSKSLPLTIDLTAEKLAEELGVVIHAAEQLYDGWNYLAEIAEQEESISQEERWDPTDTTNLKA